jgi:C1A family cysteine protease
MIKYALGCRKDPVDERDILMKMVLPVVRLPAKIDYTMRMSPVGDQGDEGTCVGFAGIVGVKEYEEKKEAEGSHVPLSVRYAYNWCKKLDGIPDEEGTYPRVMMKVLKNFGVAPSSCWPYKPHQTDFPCADADKLAGPYRIMAYARVKSLLDMKRSLVINGPFMAGVEVYEGFMTDEAAKDGIIPLPVKSEEFLGGHAICIVGYDEEMGYFKFKNSWGTRWGQKGYGYLPYDYMKKYCSDAWSATDLIPNPEAFMREHRATVVV